MVNISGSRSLTRDWWGSFRRGPKRDKNRKRKSRSSDRSRATRGQQDRSKRFEPQGKQKADPAKGDGERHGESAGNRRARSEGVGAMVSRASGSHTGCRQLL